MLKLFKKYPEGMLIALAVVFSALILGSFILGVTSAVNGIENVFNISKNETGNASFNIPAAAKLDLRGLAQ